MAKKNRQSTPVSDFIVRMGKSGRKFETAAIEAGKETVSKVSGYVKTKTVEASKRSAKRKIDRALNDIEEKAKEMVAKFKGEDVNVSPESEPVKEDSGLFANVSDKAQSVWAAVTEKVEAGVSRVQSKLSERKTAEASDSDSVFDDFFANFSKLKLEDEEKSVEEDDIMLKDLPVDDLYTVLRELFPVTDEGCDCEDCDCEDYEAEEESVVKENCDNCDCDEDNCAINLFLDYLSPKPTVEVKDVIDALETYFTNGGKVAYIVDSGPDSVEVFRNLSDNLEAYYIKFSGAKGVANYINKVNAYETASSLSGVVAIDNRKGDDMKVLAGLLEANKSIKNVLVLVPSDFPVKDVHYDVALDDNLSAMYK